MKRMTYVAAVGAIAALTTIAALPAGDVNQPATSAAQQPRTAGGAGGAMPQEQKSREQWRSDFRDQSGGGGYRDWGTPSNSEWSEPQYGGWSPEPSGDDWGSEPSATGTGDSERQWGAPLSPRTVSPDRGGAETSAASGPGRPIVDPWASSAQTKDTPQAGEAPPDSGQPQSTATYPVQPLPPAGAPPMAYGGYPGYGAGAPPPPPPGWGYGYPGYGGPPGPYGGAGPYGGGSGKGGGWPWGDMMPWGNRGGSNSPWGNWMPWGN